jgi:hypothetical protein
MLTMKASLGRIVLVCGESVKYNGADVAPAIVTRVWSDDMVNLTVFPDAETGLRATSVHIYADEQSARASGNHVAAYWPPRM